MYINYVSLLDFRNIMSADVNLKNGINIFYGPNANGKTNFLEAICICSTGRSHRTKNDFEIINFNKDESHVRVLINDNTSKSIDVHIKRKAKKGIAINNIPIKKSSELFGTLYTVMFSPEDFRLIKDAPYQRRRFIDIELCQISKVYCYNLQQYMKVLKQRNELLKNIQKNTNLKDTIFVWNKQLVDYGINLIKFRKEFIDSLSNKAAFWQKQITSDTEELSIVYCPSVDENDFYYKINSNIEKDIIFGNTSFGPHRDDIIFYINNKDVKIYGSQGQQRTAALCAKLAEIDVIKENTGVKPVLLLDDVMSELDKKRQNALMNCINEIQTIITCTGIEDYIKYYTESAEVFYVSEGTINKAN